MKTKLFRLIALVTSLSLLLCGCDLLSLFDIGGTDFDDMEYIQPDVSELIESAAHCTELAQTETDFDTLWTAAEDFFNLYSNFYTQYLLAYVHYCLDMSDIYWVDEYTYCEEQTAPVEAERDRLLHVLAKSPHREALEGEDYFGEDFFDDYDGESIWTDEFQTLKEQESELVATYYQISQEGAELDPFSEEYFNSYGAQLEELYIELVLLRQQLAQSAGYDSYPEYAYEQIFYRDYTVTDAIGFCQQIYEELVPLYRELAESGFWEMGLDTSSEYETYRYVRTLAKNIGSEVEEAFDFMKQYDLYDISFGSNKFDNAFEVYFYDYEQPYVFVAPNGSELDQLTFAHEFGHFCNDLASYGSVAGIDTAEVFSQGMEYLSLIYAEPSEELALRKLGDTLCVYVEQGAYACFEYQVYDLPPEKLTVEEVRGLFQKTCEGFGFDCWDFDSRSYVTVPHFFIQPIYVISYVVSNDTAFQLYQLEQRKQGSGLDIYLESLDTEQEHFLSFLEETGLDSPFLEGRIQTVRQTLEDALR